jgi:osmotically-inducible protein OsmY
MSLLIGRYQACWLPVMAMLALLSLGGCTAMLMGGGGQGGGGAGTASDSAILEQVRSALANDMSVDNSNISVEVSRQVVFLRGSVPTATQRVRAGEVAASIGQVAAVRNHLRVPAD